MLLSMKEHILAEASLSPPSLAIFSGHDVNILGLLYGIGATVVDPSAPPFWPDVG
jgi:hypothetical protein